MIENEGRYAAEVLMDTIALVEEYSPGCTLTAVQVTLVVREPDGTTRTGTVLREKDTGA